MIVMTRITFFHMYSQPSALRMDLFRSTSGSPPSSVPAGHGFCQCAGFEQREAENNGVSCKGENRAVQVIRYNHAVYQNRINADAYHNQKALKTDSEQGF